MNYEVSMGAESWRVSVKEVGGSVYEVTVDDGETVRIDVAKTPRTVYSLLIGSRQYEASVDEHPDGSFDVHVGTSAFDLGVIDERRKALASAAAGPAGGVQELRAQMPGKIVKMLVEVGDSVEPGDGLVIIEAMKMENELRAEVAGNVTAVHVAEGETVETEELLVVVEPPEQGPACRRTRRPSGSGGAPGACASSHGPGAPIPPGGSPGVGMTVSRRHWRQLGFTLVEMLMVLAIIGILASIAVPKYRNVTMRTRRAEAYAGLAGIQKAQEAYYAEFAEYTDSFDELGVTFDGGTVVDDSTIDGRTYRFQIGTYDLTDVNSNYWATATGDLAPGDGIVDVLLLEPGATVLE